MFNWIKALLLSAARWADAERGERERERERGVCALNEADAEKRRGVGAPWNRADAEREEGEREEKDREGVRAAEQSRTQREREKRERERGEVCARGWESKTLRSRGSQWFSETRFGRFFEGKRSLKGSAMLLSWQHCASPFLQLRVGPQVKPEIRAALIAR